MRRAHRRSMPRKLMLELLEDRTVPSSASAATAYGQLPLAFEVNQGQAPKPIDFLARGNGYTLDLTAQNAHLDLGGTALDLHLVGAGTSSAVGLDPLITRTNYLVGNDPSQWHTNIPNFGRVEYQNVYAGVNLVYHGNQGQLEYDFVVAPGANPNAIKLSIQGAQSITLDAQGNLVLHTAGSDVTEQAPVVYQDIGGVRQSVAGKFVLEGNTVGFQVGAYDPTQPLVIDPTLSYATYIGGGGTFATGSAMYAIAVDSTGAVYLTGESNIEVYVAKLNAAGSALVYQTFLGGSVDNGAPHGNGIAIDAAGDAYVTGVPGANFPTTANAFSQSSSSGFFMVLNPTGSGLLYSTYIPGAALEPNNSGPNSGGIAIDSAGNAYVTGPAGSGFITTPGAFQSALATGATSNAFLAEINPNLPGSASLIYGSYLGGSGTDAGTGVAVDSSGSAYVTGYTNSSNFPATTGAFQTTLGGGYDDFVAKFNPALSGSASLVYSTYLGGSGAEGVPFLHLVPDGGGIPGGFYSAGPAIVVDSSGDAFVAGSTNSTNFPTTAGAYEPSVGSLSNGTDAFVTKLNPAGSGLVYSTYLGPNSPGTAYYGNAADDTRATSIVLDSAGNAYVAGLTRSDAFPVTSNAIQSTLSGSLVNIGTAHKPKWVRENVLADAFVTTLNPTGSSLLFSTYYGGTGDDFGLGVALDSAGNTYVAGVTDSDHYPTTAGAYDSTSPFTGHGMAGFAFKIDPPVEPGGSTAAVTATTDLSAGNFARSLFSIAPPDADPALANALASAPPNSTSSAPATSPPASASSSPAMPIAAGIGAAPLSLPIAMSGGGEDVVDQVFMDLQADGCTDGNAPESPVK
jgi:hypothetical protein